MKNDLFKIIKCYSKHHIKSITLFCMFSLIFGIVFSLYKLELKAVLYAILLCFSIGFVIVLIDFIKYYKHHKIMIDLKEKITISLEELPIPHNLVEQDYTELIKTIHDDKIRITYETDSSKKDMVEYYTLWVHQIKTPIAAMRLLLQSDDNTHNNELSSELFKIEQYVEMVLSYLRINNNSNDFIFKRYSLDNIVKQSVRKYAPLFVRKKLGLDFETLNCYVLTDEKWLSFVIEQILSNSLKYTNKGKISIYMTNNTTLVIEDTGIGIAAEDLPRIGEKGFTGYNGRTYKKATGIGLYLCKQILNKLSHTITIKSEVGVGTKVFIDLEETKLLTE